MVRITSEEEEDDDGLVVWQYTVEEHFLKLKHFRLDFASGAARAIVEYLLDAATKAWRAAAPVAASTVADDARWRESFRSGAQLDIPAAAMDDARNYAVALLADAYAAHVAKVWGGGGASCDPGFESTPVSKSVAKDNGAFKLNLCFYLSLLRPLSQGGYEGARELRQVHASRGKVVRVVIGLTPR